jgi:hypothetical protein
MSTGLPSLGTSIEGTSPSGVRSERAETPRFSCGSALERAGGDDVGITVDEVGTGVG